MAEHARLAPSSAEKWLNCRGSLAMEAGLPESTSSYAEEGSAAHWVAENVLKNRLNPTQAGKPLSGGQDAAAYIGTYPLAKGGKPIGPQVTAEMAEHVQRYIDTVWALAEGNDLLVERRVDFSAVIGVPEQFGTADAIILAGSELQIHDLKYGFLKVDAENNKQLQLYALGALDYFSLAQDFDRVRLFIHQPRLNRTSEWALSVDALEAFGEQAREAAAAAMVTANLADCEGVDTLPADVFTPGEKQCRWCKAAGGLCKAETEYYLNLIAGDFVDLTQPLTPQLADAPKRIAALTPDALAAVYGQLPALEGFCKSVYARVMSELRNGRTLPGLKLVQGKPGNRAWRDEAAARALLKDQFRYKMDDIFDMKLISPTRAEKLIKKASPRRWPKVEPLITRPDGKPVVAPQSDPRPALNMCTENDFDNVDAQEATAELL